MHTLKIKHLWACTSYLHSITQLVQTVVVVGDNMVVGRREVLIVIDFMDFRNVSFQKAAFFWIFFGMHFRWWFLSSITTQVTVKIPFIAKLLGRAGNKYYRSTYAYRKMLEKSILSQFASLIKIKYPSNKITCFCPQEAINQGARYNTIQEVHSRVIAIHSQIARSNRPSTRTINL